jgi:type IV pilus biogenesis protein CpaD/CtpE
MKTRPHLIAAVIATVLLPHGRVSGADFGDDRPHISRQAAAKPYSRFRAAVDACEAGRSFVTVGDENSDFDPAIGCSTGANLAAMVSRPRDLVRGQGARYHDAERASNIVGNYRAWKAPGGSDQVKGSGR